MDPSDIQQHAIDALSNRVTWTSIITIAIYVLGSLISKWFDYRSKRLDGKQMDDFVAALESLKESVGDAATKESVAHAVLDKFMENNLDIHKSVRETMSELLARHSGAMDKDTSVRLLDRFFADLTRDAIQIVTNSLEQNGYAERPEYIRDRVKTLIAQALESTRAALSYFKLSVPVKPYFATVPNEQNVDRFLLCDQIWEEIEPMYLLKASPKARLEEARLKVQNVIRDYTAVARHDALENPVVFLPAQP